MTASPEPKRLNIQLPAEIAAKLEWLCAHQRRGQTNAICFAIERMWQAEKARQEARTAAGSTVGFTRTSG